MTKDRNDEAEDLLGMADSAEIAAYKAGLKRGSDLAALRIEELKAELREAYLQALAAHGQANDAYDVAQRLQDTIREALRLMERPHYGNVDTKIDNYFDAFDLLRAALESD